MIFPYSLDDSIITKQNILLLDNVTNYNQTAVDYFHYDFSKLSLLTTSWHILTHMGKYNIMRLPSCSNEIPDDYYVYLKRLHHCLWRRWSILQLNLPKVDPLSLNWNKECDVTVLYGPYLNTDVDDTCTTDVKAEHNVYKDGDNLKYASYSKALSMNKELNVSTGSINTTNSTTLSTSPSSLNDSIFSNNATASSADGMYNDADISMDDYDEEEYIKPILKKVASSNSNNNVHFDDIVLQRDVDRHGIYHEHFININDKENEYYYS
ncbi:uncharacterized protein SCODWIG_03990 [Saccharomycodes ludwigii]|uniref:Uncharacterized protein n=1 Tax=Saccharomycodes ludwigii TaxID=36035 RepID=A0A376BC07_9ASCO|nr:hypothetical protein SCDLUD_003151 [Saccharomycodes ludwigii]KAH3900180.1 hypothetical protein SCDLUD_003151 [Saccharomycodes ludwigii]SSD62228.1 uncharacterized protein SCODWIG_03990 [Saccharomycodes ludwigii]